jgi:hypothetical protein
MGLFLFLFWRREHRARRARELKALHESAHSV